jgi:hypothetical protein
MYQSTCGHDRFEPSGGCDENEKGVFETDVVWEGLTFTCSGKEGEVNNIVCHDKAIEYFQITLMCDADDLLSTIIERETKCDIAWNVELEFKP